MLHPTIRKGKKSLGMFIFYQTVELYFLLTLYTDIVVFRRHRIFCVLKENLAITSLQVIFFFREKMNSRDKNTQVSLRARKNVFLDRVNKK